MLQAGVSERRKQRIADKLVSRTRFGPKNVPSYMLVLILVEGFLEKHVGTGLVLQSPWGLNTPLKP